MADRDIFCCKCGKYVGTIRDAKLQKGLKFICEACGTVTRDRFDSTADFTAIFGKIFNEKFK